LTRWERSEAGERTGEGSWTDEVGSRIWNDTIVRETGRMKTTNKGRCGAELLHTNIIGCSVFQVG